MKVLLALPLAIGLAQGLATAGGKIGRLPAMGFNSWNDKRVQPKGGTFWLTKRNKRFSATSMNQSSLQQPKKLSVSSLKDAGYKYANIDGI